MEILQNRPYSEIIERKAILHQRFRRYLTFKGGGNGIETYIGNDLAGLREWIESNFLSEMNWDNYGRIWVVDHIVPMRMFDIFNDEDLRICYHYKNLMPLFRKDNQNKEGNLFFSYELLLSLKDKDFFYKKLFERIHNEVARMGAYIDKFHTKYAI